jgi:CheY-like chemotaxis protein
MQQAHVSPRASRSSVLVIEEHPFQRRTLAKRLHALGVPRVLEAARAAEALELLGARAGSIALILSSVDMPELDAHELLRALAAEAPQTAVAVLSTLDRTPIRAKIESKAVEYGLHLIGMLEKPVTDDALRAVLVRALAGAEHAEHAAQGAAPAERERTLDQDGAADLLTW